MVNIHMPITYTLQLIFCPVHHISTHLLSSHCFILFVGAFQVADICVLAPRHLFGAGFEADLLISST